MQKSVLHDEKNIQHSANTQLEGAFEYESDDDQDHDAGRIVSVRVNRTSASHCLDDGNVSRKNVKSV